MDHDAEIRELLAANSFIIRNVKPENLSKLRQLFHPQAVELAEYLQLFDFRLEQVVWKGAPPYSLLLHFAAESDRRYLVTTDGETMRLYGERISADDLLGDWQVAEWRQVAAALLKTELANSLCPV
jgi:hypothetical protein